MKRFAIVACVAGLGLLTGCFSLLDLPPSAVITTTETTGDPPLVVSFSALESSDDEEIVSYAWSFGDGRQGIGEACEHTYTHPGVYVAHLTVRDAGGRVDTDSVTIIVRGVAPDIRRSFAWESHDESWTWEIAIPKTLYAGYAQKTQRDEYSESYECDWTEYVTDASDDALFTSLSIELFDRIAPCYDDPSSAHHGFLQFALDFITAAIPYVNDSGGDWPRYPVETLAEVGGDCEDTAFLYCSIVRPHVERIHLLIFKGHAACAVPVDWSFVATRDYPVACYTCGDVYMAFVETSADPPNYRRVGELRETLRDAWEEGGFVFYDVSRGVASHINGMIHRPGSGG